MERFCDNSDNRRTQTIRVIFADCGRGSPTKQQELLFEAKLELHREADLLIRSRAPANGFLDCKTRPLTLYSQFALAVQKSP